MTTTVSEDGELREESVSVCYHVQQLLMYAPLCTFCTPLFLFMQQALDNEESHFIRSTLFIACMYRTRSGCTSCIIYKRKRKRKDSDNSCDIIVCLQISYWMQPRPLSPQPTYLIWEWCEWLPPNDSLSMTSRCWSTQSTCRERRLVALAAS